MFSCRLAVLISEYEAFAIIIKMHLSLQSRTVASVEVTKWAQLISLAAADAVAPLALRSNHISSHNSIRNRKYKYAFSGLYPRKSNVAYPNCAAVQSVNLLNYKPSTNLLPLKLGLSSIQPNWNIQQKRLFSSQRKEEPNPFRAHAFDYDIYEKSFHIHDHKRGPWLLIAKEAESLYHLYKHDSGGKKLTILTLAAGPGELPISLAKALPEANVYSTDISVRMVELSTKKAQELKIKNMISLILDMEDMSQFDDQSFDLVSCCYGLAHVNDIHKALNEIHR